MARANQNSGLLGAFSLGPESTMPSASLRNLDVDGLLALRAEVEKALAERAHDLETQLRLLGEPSKPRGRPPGLTGRKSAMKGKTVAPKYRGPNGEAWAGRGATRLAALIKEGHSAEEFLIGSGRKTGVAAKRQNAKKKGRKSARKPRRSAATEKNKQADTAAD